MTNNTKFNFKITLLHNFEIYHNLLNPFIPIQRNNNNTRRSGPDYTKLLNHILSYNTTNIIIIITIYPNIDENYLQKCIYNLKNTNDAFKFCEIPIPVNIL